MSTVPKDQMNPPKQAPDVNSSAPATGKGQVNLGPPIIGIGPYPGDPITGLDKGNIPAPAGVKPFKDSPK
jgi:hypothetical protein